MLNTSAVKSDICKGADAVTQANSSCLLLSIIKDSSSHCCFLSTLPLFYCQCSSFNECCFRHGVHRGTDRGHRTCADGSWWWPRSYHHLFLMLQPDLFTADIFQNSLIMYTFLSYQVLLVIMHVPTSTSMLLCLHSVIVQCLLIL